MKKIFLLLLLLQIFFLSMKAQTPADALRSAWFIPNTTARTAAIGGAMASLGGDISANYINPAGIGLFKTSEVVLSPGFMFHNNKINFRGENSTQINSGFAYGASGFIAGSSNPRSGKWTSSAFSISINQLASYNNHISYKGLNNVSSFSEQYVEELVRDGANSDAALSNYIFGSSLAYRTYLIDSVNMDGQFVGYTSLVPVPTGIIQERDEKTFGGIHEISFAFAGNMEDRLYVGGSLNIPIASYRRDLTYKETDATTDVNNNFNYFVFTENFKSSGIGINARFGMIYKPQNSLRLGIAFHSPSFITFTDNVRAAMTTDTEGYAGTLSESSDNLNSGNSGERKYNELTPWRLIGSASYVFGEVQNVKLQKGFITADIEYVGYGGSRFYVTAANSEDQTGKDYFSALNETVKDYLKGAVNVRLGGEIKSNTFAVRLGGAYYGSPYRDTQLKAHRLMAAGGIGYRNYGFFVDLTYAATFNNDVNFPYRLNDKPNTFAEWKDTRGNVILTVGFKI